METIMKDSIREAIRSLPKKDLFILAQTILSSTPREEWDENLKLVNGLINGLMTAQAAMKHFYDFAVNEKLNENNFWQIDLQFETLLYYCARAAEEVPYPEGKAMLQPARVTFAFSSGLGDWPEARDNLQRIGWLAGHPELSRGEFVPVFANTCVEEVNV